MDGPLPIYLLTQFLLLWDIHRHSCGLERERRERERCYINDTVTCHFLDEVSKAFIPSSFKHFNEIVVGGSGAMSLLPQLQCSPPEREREGVVGWGAHKGENLIATLTFVILVY